MPAIALPAAGLGLLVVLAGCGGSSPAVSSHPAATSASAGAATGAGGSVTATETDFHIALSRSSFTAGTYTFTVEHAGQTEHALIITDSGGAEQSVGDIKPGSSGHLTVTLKAGSYEVFCPVANHKMLGMDLHVTVT